MCSKHHRAKAPGHRPCLEEAHQLSATGAGSIKVKPVPHSAMRNSPRFQRGQKVELGGDGGRLSICGFRVIKQLYSNLILLVIVIIITIITYCHRLLILCQALL